MNDSAPSPASPPTAAAAPAPAAAAAPRRGRRVWAMLRWLPAVMLALPAALPPLLWQSPAVLAWALALVPGLQVAGLRGAPGQGEVAIQRLDWTLPAQAGRLQIESLRLSGWAWQWRPHAGAWLGLSLQEAEAARVVYRSGPPSASPITAPQDLHWPLALTLQRLAVQQLQIDALPPVEALSASLALGAEAGAVHRIDGLQARWERVVLRDGRLRLASAAPLALQARLAAEAAGPTSDTTASPPTATLAGQPWQATLQADGPLQRLQLQARLAGPAAAGRAAPALEARAQLQPFAAWPLAGLQLDTRALDLAALSARLPQTALAGHAELRSQAADQPAEAAIALSNDRPGRWDEGRLPLRRLALQLTARPNAPTRLSLRRFELTLADGQADAGRLHGSGQWLDDRLELTLQLDALQPARLHGQAAALRIGGPLTLRASGLPTPAGSALRPDWHLALQATLDGQATDGSGAPVRLTLTGDGSARRWRLNQAEARSGSALARLQGQLLREADGWRLSADGRLQGFDPRPWWRGAEGSAWRRGPHRLEAQARAQLRWRDVGGDDDWRRRFDGELVLSLGDSLLAGVPLSGQATLQAGRSGVQLASSLVLGGNRLGLEGLAAVEPAAEHWSLQADAPALAALAPLSRLAAEAWPAAADWLPLEGRLRAQARLDGRWPTLRSRGELQAQGLRSRSAGLTQAEAHWSDGEAPALQLSARGLSVGAQGLDRVELQAAGNAGAHSLRLVVDSPLKPPAWTAPLLGSVDGGSRVALDGRGAWTAIAGGGGRWQWQALQLRAGATTAAADAAAWAEARELTGQLQFDAGGALQSLRLAPGRLQLPGTALRWREVLWEPAAAVPRLALSAELETIDVARLLARLQPAMGWSGDLTVGGRIDIRAAERVDADIVLERGGGDLAITDELGNTQALGLSELRLALSAHDGLWQFAQGLAGRNVGEMAGAQVLRSDPAQRWPGRDTPLSGVIQARAANLGQWGVWTPPGWRLGGSLRTSASVGGTLGAPELRGEMRGQDLTLRNVLQGIHLSDGELALRLDGERATIERFAFKGGDGRLELDGQALLGAAPSARLQLTAERFRLLGRIDRRVVASGRAELQLDAQSLKLDGRFSVDEGLIDFSRSDAPVLDEDVQVRRGNGAAEALPRAAAPLPAPLRNAQVALALNLGEKLQLRGRGLDAGLRGELQVSSPGGRPALNGTVRTHGGSYVAYGQKLAIERGELSLSGAVDNARLDVLAIRPNLDVQVGVAVTGTVQSPRIRLTSDSDMTDYEKLSWLVLGRSSDGLGRADTALLQRAAVALLAGDGKAPTDTLLQVLGLTDFSVYQTSSSSTTSTSSSSDSDVRQTVVSLGKQLSQRWYVGYERGVNATTGTWQLVYRIARRFTLRAQSGSENAVDLIWSWRW